MASHVGPGPVMLPDAPEVSKDGLPRVMPGCRVSILQSVLSPGWIAGSHRMLVSSSAMQQSREQPRGAHPW